MEEQQAEHTNAQAEADVAEGLVACDDPFIMGSSLFWDVYSLLRDGYGALQQLCTLATPDSLRRLPGSLALRHMWNEKKLPTLELCSRRVPVDIRALPAGRPTQPDPTTVMWLFNPINLITTLVNEPVIIKTMYFRIRQMLERESDFYHS